MAGAGDWEALEIGEALRQVLILALDFSSGPLTNFKGAFHKIHLSSMVTLPSLVGIGGVIVLQTLLRGIPLLPVILH
jgi:hypothetical protein